MGSRLAFIGLGIMGRPMAGHLLAGGHELVVHTRTPAKAAELVERGAKLVDSAADAAQQADVVFVCVPDTPDVQQVILGQRGIIDAARPGLVVVDNSTISPAATREMAEALRARGATLLDAPISGGDVGARNATLSIMVGGDADAFARVEPPLRLMGKSIVHCGPSGAGQLTKLVNQILVSVNLLATCEAITFAKQNGLDAAKTIQAIGGGAAGSWQLLNLGPKIVAGDHAPGFMIELMLKDLRLLMQAAEGSQTPLPASSLVKQLFTAAAAAGHGRDGTQALATVLQNLAARQVD